jgi:hypothetical protein
MFDINKFLFKLSDRSMYTRYFQVESETGNICEHEVEIFEGMNMIFASFSRVFPSRMVVPWANRRRTKNQEKGGAKLVERACWLNKEYK